MTYTDVSRCLYVATVDILGRVFVVLYCNMQSVQYSEVIQHWVFLRATDIHCSYPGSPLSSPAGHFSSSAICRDPLLLTKSYHPTISSIHKVE